MYGDPETSPMVDMLWQSAAAPLLACLVGVAAWRVLRSRVSSPSWMLAPATAIGFSLAWAAIQGRAVLPPAGALDIIVVMAVGAAAIDVLSAARPTSARFAPAVAAVLVSASGGWMLYPILSRAPLWMTPLAIGAFVTLFLALYTTTSRPGHSRVRSALFVCLTLGAAPVIALDGTLKLAQLSGALAACAGVGWVAGLLYRDSRFALGVTFPWLASAIFVAAYFYADIDPLALAMLACGVLLVAEARRFSATESLVIDNLRVLIASSIPTALAVWKIWPDQPLY